MKALILLILASVILAACGAPQITVPAGTASVLYAHAYGDYQVAKLVATQACKGGRLDAETCDGFKALDTRAKIYSDNIEAALMNPTQPIDWAQVLKYSQDIISILVGLGVLGAAR